MRAALCLVLLARLTHQARILVAGTVSSPSHSLFFDKLVYSLADRGHQVIYLDTIEARREHRNVTHIVMEKGFSWRKLLDENVGSDSNVLESMSTETSPKVLTDSVGQFQLSECHNYLSAPWLPRFLEAHRGTTFDLIIFDFPCVSFYSLAPLFGDPPLIVMTAFADPASVLAKAGAYDNPAYVPVQLSTYSPRMSFLQRAYNLFYVLYAHLLQNLYVIPVQEKFAAQVFGTSIPPPMEIAKNISLVFVNTHYSLDGAKPIPPAVIPIAGFHVDPPKPLPQEMQKFLDGAEHGAVLFSLGSNVPSSTMSNKKVQMFLQAFKGIPQRVLWKHEIEVPGLPSNVMMVKWLPQSDALGHPKVKVFMSHCGLLGTQEAVYHGVPIFGIPIMYDQFEVVEKIERKGIGIKFNYVDLTVENIRETIKTLMTDQSYKRNMAELSAVFKDAPQTAREKVLFWVEYVLRHPRSELLRSAALDLRWFQLLYLDLLCFELLLGAALLFILLRIKNSLTSNKSPKQKLG